MEERAERRERGKTLGKLFVTFARIGLFTFGGGYAMIPLIQREAAEKNRWISEHDLLDITAIAESTPGPIAVNAATFVGQKVAGVAGAACATLGVVLTIPAAGSEGSNSSVITNEDGWIKRGLGCDLTRPAFAIYNPELTYSLPAYQTAAGATDIMAHIMERYFTNEPDVDMTDRLCESVLKTIIRQAPVAVKEPDNYVARAEMMWASTVAHNDFLSCFRVGDWSSHQLSHELSGMYDATHGAALAVAFPAWMTYVYKHDVQRFCRFAVEVMGVEMDFFHPEETALKGIAALRAFFKSIGMPTTLSELGVPEDKLDVLADKVKRGADGTTGQFVKLTRDDCLKIYQLMR